MIICANYKRISILRVLGKFYGRKLIERINKPTGLRIEEEKGNLCGSNFGIGIRYISL